MMQRKILRWFSFFILLVFIMQWQGGTLRKPGSPHGIIDLEFAGDTVTMGQLQAIWNPTDLYLNIALDFIFIIAYAGFLYECCRLAGKWSGFEKTARIFGWMVVSAGLLDIIENFSMLVAWSQNDRTAIRLAYYCAAIKFVFLALVLLFLAAVIILKALKKQSGAKIPVP
jgi:hypothetical protein